MGLLESISLACGGKTCKSGISSTSSEVPLEDASFAIKPVDLDIHDMFYFPWVKSLMSL